jgi:OFA family oxalate/formate antiporter-like MFS transporter
LAKNKRPGIVEYMRIPNESRLDRRWDLVALGILVHTCLGSVYSWSVFREPLEEVLGIGAAQSGLPYSIFLAAFAFSMPLGGLLISRIGTRATLMFGGVLVGAGWILSGLVGQFLTLTIAYGVVGGMGVGLGYGVPLAVVGSWFPSRRGLAMGLTLLGFGASPFVTAPLASVLIRALGVQQAMVAFGAIFLPVVFVLSFFLVPRSVPADEATAPTGQGDLNLKQMMSSVRFYGLWGCYVVGTLAGLTAIGMTSSFAQSAVGLSAATAAGSVAFFAVLNGVGRPLFGSLHDRLGTLRTVVLSFILVAGGAATASFAGSSATWAFYVGFAILWLMLGGWLAIAPAATTRLFGERHYAANYGVMYTAYGVGALAGGGASSALYAQFGSYRPLFFVMIGLCAVGMALAFATLGSRQSTSVP